MSEIVTSEDLVAEFHRIIGDVTASVDHRLAEHKGEVERLVKQRTARMPSILTGGDTAGGTLSLLGSDRGFRDWLRGPRGAKSAYAASFSPTFALR